MNTGVITKKGRVTATPTREDRCIKVDFGGHSQWFVVEDFRKNRIVVKKGDHVEVEFVTTVGKIRKVS